MLVQSSPLLSEKAAVAHCEGFSRPSQAFISMALRSHSMPVCIQRLVQSFPCDELKLSILFIHLFIYFDWICISLVTWLYLVDAIKM